MGIRSEVQKRVGLLFSAFLSFVKPSVHAGVMRAPDAPALPKEAVIKTNTPTIPQVYTAISKIMSGLEPITEEPRYPMADSRGLTVELAPGVILPNNDRTVINYLLPPKCDKDMIFAVRQRINPGSASAIDHHHVGFFGRIGHDNFCYVHDMEEGNLIEALAIQRKDGTVLGSYGSNNDILSHPDGPETKDRYWLKNVIQTYLFDTQFGPDGNPIISAKVSYGGNAAKPFDTLALLEAWRDANDGNGETSPIDSTMVNYMSRLAKAAQRLEEGGETPSMDWADGLNLPQSDINRLIQTRAR